MAATFLTRHLNPLIFSAAPSRSHYGYLPFEGRIPRITENTLNKGQIKAINLKPVKRISYRVDPLHPNSHSIRKLMTIISNEKIVRTGPKTTFKNEFVSDRSEPTVTLTFHDSDKKLVFKSAYLTEHEIIYELNKIVLPMVKEDTAKTSASGKPSGKMTRKK